MEVVFMNKIITISRQYGSGGRGIGKQLAKELGIPCYDYEIIERVAQESGFAKEFIEQNGEYASSAVWIGNSFVANGSPYGGMNVHDSLWVAQRAVIIKLAEEGPCVFVGRCADYILRDKQDVISAFIYADMDSRLDRLKTKYGQSAEATQRNLKDKDKRRAAYYRFYTDDEWGDVKNYDVCLNSGRIGDEACVQILKEIYNDHVSK